MIHGNSFTFVNTQPIGGLMQVISREMQEMKQSYILQNEKQRTPRRLLSDILIT